LSKNPFAKIILKCSPFQNTPGFVPRHHLTQRQVSDLRKASLTFAIRERN
jgi:hypothetical protein